MTTPAKVELKPPLVFRIGVIGHRLVGSSQLKPDAEKALEELLYLLLQAVHAAFFRSANEPAIKGSFSTAPPTCRVVCSLAEGVDTMAGEIGIKHGYDLQVVLPFARDDYFGTFESADAVRKSEQLMTKASAVLSLPDRPMDLENMNRGFQAAAHVILAQSDLLLAVWDGKEGRGLGGTQDTLRRAVGEFGLPVLLVKLGQPNEVFHIRTPRDFRDLSEVRLEGEKQIDSALFETMLFVLNPPRTIQKSPTFSFWDAFWDNFGLRRERKANLEGTSFENYLAEQPDPESILLNVWDQTRSILPLSIEAASRPKAEADALKTERSLLDEHYKRADRLAIYYSSVQRGAMVSVIGLGVLAAVIIGTADVFGNVLGPDRRGILVFSYVLLLFALTALIGVTRNKAWNERWIDYRLLAEALRQVEYAQPLGSVRILPQAGAFNVYAGHPSTTWMAWLVRALIRHAGLRNGVHSLQSFAEAKEAVRTELVKSQMEYQATKGTRIGEFARIAQVFGGAFLFTTLIINILLILSKVEWPEARFLSGIAAAVGTGLLAVANVPEFGRAQKRSESMKSNLKKYDEQLSSIPGLDFLAARELFYDLSALLIRETADWRVLFTDRPPEFGDRRERD